MITGTGLDLKIRRIRAGILQRDLAWKMGYRTGVMLSMVETGKRPADAEFVKRYLEALEELKHGR